MKTMKVLFFCGLIFMMAGCSPKDNEPATLTVMTHDSFAISEDVILAFQEESKFNVKFITTGDTGTAVNKAILSKDAPLADVFYGLDNTFLSRALDEGIFEVYSSPSLIDIPNEFKLDPQNRVAPVNYGDICLNYDIAYYLELGLAPPENLDDLVKPEYLSHLVVENPATSSPGLGFLLATISRFGDPGYLKFWESLVENDVKVVNDWETAYYSEFSRWGGSRPIAVSYGSSPPFEIIFAEEPMDQPPTAAIVSDGSCFRQIEFVGILKGTKNRIMAEEFVDFMLSQKFQEDIPLQMFVFPVNNKARLDETFVNYLDIPEITSILDPALIAVNREKWIKEWTDTVLR
jgi:thiamine transport system substrate-binding protein